MVGVTIDSRRTCQEGKTTQLDRVSRSANEVVRLAAASVAACQSGSMTSRIECHAKASRSARIISRNFLP